MGSPSFDLLAISNDPDGGTAPKRNSSVAAEPKQIPPFFKSLQWSADGTTLFTSSSEKHVCSYVLPETLLEPRDEPLQLKAHATLILGEQTSAIAPCPYFALENSYTHSILTASSDHPIHLHYAFPQQPSSDDGLPITTHQPPPIASFRLIKKETEAYLPIASLIWPAPGTHFIAGTTNRIAIFDVSNPSSLTPEPLFSIATIPSTRHIRKGNGIGMRGTISALAAQVRESGDAGLIAVGTRSRFMGLYDLQRAGECVATWGIAASADEAGIGGGGVTQTVWSPCGRYLVVNERASRGLLVYDLRGTNELLAHLEGRNGDTNQRLSCDVHPGTSAVGGFEVWAGTKDGGVVMWEGVGNESGAVSPSGGWDAHESAVGSTAMHTSGSVVATCSGSWEIAGDGYFSDSDCESGDSGDEDSDESSSCSGSTSEPSPLQPKRSPFVVKETSLKVWSIGSIGLPKRGTPEAEDDKTRT
ncbi:WD40-repeat-containing domain protein [Immersiella caudata]|uniref:WD40-repeat-containing domain protein n=1 Tax=Immersiella caudata TaxID=314043 RepID=A0AA39WRC7_9PEZI|nr:WD40-repeat-containing domain protein [Immersiella caudata]